MHKIRKKPLNHSGGAKHREKTGEAAIALLALCAQNLNL